MLIAVVLSVILFRRYHSLSYFRKVKAEYRHTGPDVGGSLPNSQPGIEHGISTKLSIFMNSIIIPCYWVFSTRQNVKEFWSRETVFWTQLSPLAAVAPHKMISEEGTSPVLVPRRPEYQETSFTNEGSLLETRRLHVNFPTRISW